MSRLRSATEMPLLAKELIEQAIRRRTYVVRFLYAAALFTLALFVFYGNVWGTADAGNLGQGRFMFERLVALQFWAIYLLVPALVCGVITIEKEQDSLSLLLLTTLSPGSILFQKLVGRLIPVLSFLLLSLPLMAVAYSFGGVSETHLWAGILLLVASSIQIGTMSLMCSAYFPTTAAAFVASYLCVIGVAVTGAFDGRAFFYAAIQRGGSPIAGVVVILISTAVAFAVARMSLVTRAFVAPRNAILQVFEYLDGIANEANEITGGVVLFHDKNLLPEERPIAWRETAKKPLGTARYLFRVLTALELPILATCQWINSAPRSSGEAVSTLLYILWGVSAVLIAVHAAGLVSSERSRQTLDVLLTAPLPGRRILLEKFQGVRRLMVVLLVPFATIYWFQDWWRRDATFWYLTFSALTVAVYLPLVAWFSLWLGLKVRSQRRAILGSLGVLFLWTVVPLAALYGIGGFMGMRVQTALGYLFALSPSVVITSIETPRPSSSLSHSTADLVVYGLSFSLHAALLLYFRYLCLSQSDRLLGRVPVNSSQENLVDPAISE